MKDPTYTHFIGIYENIVDPSLCKKIIDLFVKSSSLRRNIRKILKAMGDLERLAGRAGAEQAGAGPRPGDAGEPPTCGRA